MDKKNSKSDSSNKNTSHHSTRKRGIPNSGTKVFLSQPSNNKLTTNIKSNKSIQADLEGFSESVNRISEKTRKTINKSNTPRKKSSSTHNKAHSSTSKKTSDSSKSAQKRASEHRKSSSLSHVHSKATTKKSSNTVHPATTKKDTGHKSTAKNKTKATNIKSNKTKSSKSSTKKIPSIKSLGALKKTSSINANKKVSPKKSKKHKVQIYKRDDSFKRNLVLLSVVLSTIVILTLIIIFHKNLWSEKLVNNKLSVESEVVELDSSLNPLSSINNIIKPVSSSTEAISYELVIESGMSAKDVAHLIALSNFVDEEKMLNYFIDNDLSSKINIGTYYIFSSMSLENIADTICISDNLSLTIYPGLSIDQIDTLLVKRNLIEKGEFLKACTSISLEYGLDFVEGWFFSGKYDIDRGLDVNELALLMFKTTLKSLSPYLEDIAKSNFSINDILIIASLIQAETNNTDDMPLISEVIHNRLKANMPLGINATTCYEIGVYTADIDQELYDKITPYNTRRQKGLVPTPICSLSLDSLKAAIYPSKGDYLYYNHDKNGNIHMALTYEEHLSNVEGNYTNGI